MPLLRPIVKIALDPATRLVGGGHDAHARGFQLRPRLHVRERTATSAAKSARRASVFGGSGRCIE
jgi:hypothetical protein